MRALVLVADALLRGVPIVPARARIHRRHEHERGRVFGRVLGSANGNHPVLQRLPHDLQNGAIEFRQFIHKKDAVVGQGDFAGHREGASATQGDRRNGVVRTTEGARRHQGRALRQFAGDAVYLGRLEGLAQRERRHD